MKPRSFLKLFLLGSLGLSLGSSISAENSTVKSVKLLTIGNSFTQNATNYLGDLVEQSPHKLHHTKVSVGGSSLELHATKALAYQKNPKDLNGLYANEKNLFQYLEGDTWDYVTIQQASIKSHDYSTYQPFGDQLAKLIRTHAPEAKLLIHETWAYRSDDPRFNSDKPKKEGEPQTQKEMYEGIKSSYHQLAKRLNAPIIPVGDAFWAADNDPTFGYKKDASFDLKSAKKPQLPDQKHSLHIGWKWSKTRKSPDKIVLTMDGHHANLAGEFLGACVWYETLFGEDVRKNSFVPDKLDPAYAAFLKEKAHQAVQANPIK